VYYCPHHPDFSEECSCRKPNPGMLLQAQKKFDIDLKSSILVGDKISDIEAGVNAGIIHNYLISTGHKIGDKVDNFNFSMIDSMKELMEGVIYE
jgi:D-glycero-D-manno-heptose 1,7-bisphosphate phosphatase